MKRFLALLAALTLLTPCALAASALPVSGPAPYPPVASAYTDDGMGYDDGTLKIRIEQSVTYGTNITYVYVTLTDATQLRTALAAKFPSKKLQPVDVMARQNNAVLAINGDYFTYHKQGIVVRGGETLRFQPREHRDTLVIDDQGDFTILTKTTKAAWEALTVTPREAFCFGPGLIVDGEPQTFRASDKVSCGANTKAQRLAICQLGHLEYLLVATEGPEQDKKAGLTLPEFTELLLQTGAKQAYNLDGGSSVTVMLGDNRINAPGTKNRNVGDIIYFATLQQP